MPLTPAHEVQLEQWLEEACEAFELELYDVEFQAQGKWIIRAFVEPPGKYEAGQGVSIEQCAQVSRYLEALMDVDESIPERYTLEVSSPGIERRLNKPAHYQKMLGETISLKLRKSIQGQYRITGTLVAFEDHTVTVDAEDEQGQMQRLSVELPEIKRANVTFDFDK